MASRTVLGWRPKSDDDVAWLRALAARQGRGAIGRLLDEALALLRKEHEQDAPGSP